MKAQTVQRDLMGSAHTTSFADHDQPTATTTVNPQLNGQAEATSYWQHGCHVELWSSFLRVSPVTSNSSAWAAIVTTWIVLSLHITRAVDGGQTMHVSRVNESRHSCQAASAVLVPILFNGRVNISNPASVALSQQSCGYTKSYELATLT
jgi:hypothetical protein